MAEIIDMPKLSDTMEVGTIVNWLKQEGDAVSVGDILCEVETDKATMELENLVTDGVIIKIYTPAGGEAPIGAPICAIGEKGEAAPEPKAPAKAEKPFDDAPKEPAADKEVSTNTGSAEGRKQEPIQSVETPAATEDDGKRVKISPLARKLADSKGIPINSIKGTGPGGRITKADVLEAEKNGVSAPAASPAPSAPAPAAPAAPAAGLEDKTIKVSNMRRVIAQRLLQSKTEVPHFYLETEIDATALIAMRAELNASLAELSPEQGGIKFTVNDFILKASAEALRRVPAVNAAWQGDTIQQYGAVHLAFGVALEDGLLTPVIRDAHAKSLRQISAEAKSLIKKARSKKLSPDEMAGSTFTVTNLGMYGVTGFYGIINMPNAAILSVGATIKKPVVGPNGDIIAGDRMSVGMAGDHRIIDGAVGAEFLMALKEVLEKPALMLV
ncbi:dihydrolipoamide acetyltransferase family protein [Cerasicoccus arenae]|uniref:Dihydrolipoamide acetyltransferase component of pyruvate dehydrogenase complex n=1 Tax=Cerasicoccus arenae TaxID=424488 RepID=A0A8J3D9F2_9BACT|nr:dihydrolipoamide acetyltransferase family protein [Cerasicoccus arenae]MBK1857690.1 2-oxo acid dehydrogenase subunit E2 [Cerasicoccus arenae]GHB91348.1 acetyltransferase component of pyruvate dehydrogenase complex [Cerasicoccus arenae]